MSTARKEEIIRKGFIKSLLEGKLELKDLAGINIDLEIARQAYLQGVQETTQTLIELVKDTMATAAKQDLQATSAGQALQASAAKQDLAKTVLDNIKSGVDLNATFAKQDLAKAVLDSVKTAIESLDTKADSLGTAAKQDLQATSAGQALQASAAKQDLAKTVLDNIKSGVDLNATFAKQDLAKAVLDSVKTAIESLDTKADSLGTAAKQDLLKGVMDESKELLTNLYENIYPIENLVDDCEATTGWDKGSYDTLAVDADEKEGTYSLKMFKSGAGASEWYVSKKDNIDPVLDFSKTKKLKLWLKVVEVNGADVSVRRVYLYDSNDRYGIWNVNFVANTWTLQELDLGSPNSIIEGLDLADIDHIQLSFRTSATYSGDFTVYMDYWRRAESTDKLLKSKMDEIFADMATGAGQAAILDAINEEAYVTASDNNLYAETRSDVVISTTYIATILKVRILIAGTYRVQWTMKQWADQVRGYFMVYKNGVAHGAAKSGASPFDEWSQVSDDLYFIAGDVLCIYGKEIDANQIYCKNLELDGDISEGVAYQE